MARTKISEFSATAGSNTDIDSINLAEGCAPSGINDAIRELMSQLKDFQTGAVGDSFNGPVGSTTAGTGAFTTLAASSTTTLSGLTASTALALDASKNVVSVTNTGTGSNVLATSPTFVTPVLGTPASGTVTNLTGTASININGTVGATTPAAGSFTTLSASVSGMTHPIKMTQTGFSSGLYGVISFNNDYSFTGMSGLWGGYTTGVMRISVPSGADFTVIVNGDTVTTSSVNGLQLQKLLSVGGATPGGAYPGVGAGITFPATQNASADANTLDDYERGTFTATATPGTSGTITLLLNSMGYVKTGRSVVVTGELIVDSASSPVGTYVAISTPFASATNVTNREFYSGGACVVGVPASQALYKLQMNAAASSFAVFVDASTMANDIRFDFSHTYITA